MRNFGQCGPVVALAVVFGLAVTAGIGFLLAAMYQADDRPTDIEFVTTEAPSAADGSCVVPRDFGFGSVVCVCNASSCDRLPPVEAVAADRALVFTSTKAGLRFHREELLFVPVDSDSVQTLTVDRKTRFQQVHGFGGGFTDANGINVLSLPESAQELLLRSYFSEDGLEYNMGRLPIGGTDFSTREYTYDDDHGEDTNLTHFSLQQDDHLYKIPLIKRAKAMMPASSGELRLFSTVWSPPAWMKTSSKLSGFGSLKKEHYQTYANYYVKFLEAYAAEGVDVYSVSTGNEPINGVIPFKNFNALGWSPEGMHRWLRDHFGPTIRNSTFSAVKIVAHDDQRILLPWMLELVVNKETTKYVDIIAYHWYLNFLTPSSILDAVHKDYPDKPIINTEACNGDKPWDFTRVQPGSWERGELYIDDIVTVMNHWTAGWIDWNMALNRQGGPTWCKNWVDAPIIVEASKGEFYLNPTYYALAHVTKFVRRDSVRVKLVSGGGGLLKAKVEHIAFERPDGGLVVILVNKHKSAHRVNIREAGRQLQVDVPAKSFITVIYWLTEPTPQTLTTPQTPTTPTA